MFDIQLHSRARRTCDGVSRRDFLRVGALAPLGLSLAGHLQAAEALTGGAPVKPGRAQSVILVFMGGGLSHHDSFDPKPEAPEEIRGAYSTIGTNVKGLRVSDKMIEMAKVMDKVSLIRSCSHTNNHHETATNWVLSGRFGSKFGDYPAMGAVVAHEKGFSDEMPPYMAVPKNPSFTWELGKSAFLGGRYESFKVGDPNRKDFRVRDLARPGSVTEKNVARRKSLLQAIDGLDRRIASNDQIETYDEFQQRAADLILSPKAKEAFDIDREPEKLREAYGRNTFGQSCLMARRLVERGVRFVTVNYGGWDHHGKIYEGLKNKLPEFDKGFAAFIRDMDAGGLLSNTLVACFGEFGRTPKINKDKGRDHWGPAGSMIFAGAGVAGGRVIGATDATGSDVIDRPVPPADVAYTIYDALGIDPRKHLHMPDGRPIEILDAGARIDELYA